MPGQRIGEVIALLESYVLGEIELPRERVMAAIKLLDLLVPDARPWPDDDEAPVFADGRIVFPFSRA